MMMLKLIWYIHQFLEISLTCRNLEPMEFKSQYGTHNHQFLTMIMQSPKTKVDFKYLIAFLKIFQETFCSLSALSKSMASTLLLCTFRILHNFTKNSKRTESATFTAVNIFKKFALLLP